MTVVLEGDMAYPYIPPPDVSEIVYQIAVWISRLHRCKVSISIDKGDAGHFTVEVANPDKPPN